MGKRRKIAVAFLLGAVITMETVSDGSFMLPGILHTPVVSAKESSGKKAGGFPKIKVVDDGEPLPDNVEYMGLVCNIKDTYSEMIKVEQSDGSRKEEEVSTMNLNNIWVSVPGGDMRTRAFGVPIFSTEEYTEKEWETKDKWHNVVGEDVPEFEAGMETARRLIREGYFQKPLEEFLSGYPEIHPKEREYTLIFTGGGRTDRKSDNTSWWDLNYILTTKAETGEQVTVATIDITKVFLVQGEEGWDDAHYRIWSAESGLWKLTEDPEKDLGRTWISQVPDQDFSDEKKVRAYVDACGADFDLLLPSGVDREVDWACKKGTKGKYEYLIWSGTTDTYELTLAIPLMEKGAGGWYMASRIRKESLQKEGCRHVLSVMMQTFRESDYVHVVREGENMWKIYKQHGKGNAWKYDFPSFIEYNHLNNPDLIYPDQNIRVPWLSE